MRRYTLASPTLAVALSDDVVYALLPNTDPQPQDYARAIVEADVLQPGYVPVFGGRSAKLVLDIDCKATRLRLIALTVYPRPKFKGRPSARPAAGDWLPPPPASTLESIWRSVCDPAFIHPLPADQAPAPSKIPGRK
jgi:hypothetical protein